MYMAVVSSLIYRDKMGTMDANTRKKVDDVNVFMCCTRG